MAETGITEQRLEINVGKPVELPGGDFVANAQMTREGSDLHLTSPDGHTVTVEGYFARETPPDLITADGSRLSPQMVDAFVPPERTGQYASSGQIANDASPAGRIAEVSGEAHIIRADGTQIPAKIDTPVYQGDVIETTKSGAVNIEFADNTTFAISESARMSVDQFIYDSAHQSGTSFFSMLQGVFVYTSGLIGKADPGNVNIDTPVGQIGIRGTVVAGQIATGGRESKITILDGAIALTNASGTHVMNDSFATVSLNSYQNQPTNLGRMDAQTFSQNFSSVASVAGSTLSHFSSGAAHAAHAARGDEDSAAAAQSDGSDAPAADAPPVAPAPAAPPAGAAPVPGQGPGAMPPALGGPAPAEGPGVAPPVGAQPINAPIGPLPTGVLAPNGGNIIAGPAPQFYGPAPAGAGFHGPAPTFFGPGTGGKTATFAYNAGGIYGSVVYSPVPITSTTTQTQTNTTTTTTSPPPAGPFSIGFLYSQEYNDTGRWLGTSVGMREFAPIGAMVGQVNPLNASGAVTYNIAVNLANLPQRINPEYLASTNVALSPTLTSGEQADLEIVGSIVPGDQFSLRAGAGTPVVFTITSGKSVNTLISEINAAGFHAEMISNKLEISLLNNDLTIANVTGTPATQLLGSTNVANIQPIHDYFLSNLNPTTAFTINAAGQIFVNDSMVLSHFINPSGLNLTITATDSAGHISVLNQNIAIRDFLPGIDPDISYGPDIFGTGGSNFLVAMGSANTNVFGNGGADILVGNFGNNVLSISDNTFKGIDGGGGFDKLSLGTASNTNFFIDFINPSTGRVRDIEAIDLGVSSNSGYGNGVRLGIEDVFEMTGPSRVLNISANAGSHHSYVDVVTSGAGAFSLSSSAPSAAPTTVTYTGTYNGVNVTLVIDGGVNVTATNGQVQVNQI